MPDIYCRHERKPISERTCNLVPCKGVDWTTSEWSKCVHEPESSGDATSTTEASVDIQPNQNGHLKNQTKLSTIQTRTVLCTTDDGIIYEDQHCGLARRPEAKRKCERKEEVAQWFTSEWSSCSAIECGKGYRTRTVACAVHIDNGSGEQSIKIVDEKDCNENVKPNCEEECLGKQEVCDELYLVGPWTGCVERCEETRSIICLAKNQTTNHTGPISCEDRTGNFELRRKCISEDAKDSVDPQTECNPDDLAKNCTTTEFGCCPGSDESAEGLNFKGCESKLDEECEKSLFGCCQHIKSSSYGPFQLGCTLNCNHTRFGCCPDRVTIAQTETLDDCQPLCASTEFGCCQNNSTAIDLEKSNCPENAKQPTVEEVVTTNQEECEEDVVVEGSGSSDEIEGSGDQVDPKPVKVCKKKASSCKDSKYGCCDDQTTVKLDENGLGCEQVSTANTEQNCEKNPESPGCKTANVASSCQQTEFGCCPDGITISTGKH